jgi:hypothetical protein
MLRKVLIFVLVAVNATLAALIFFSGESGSPPLESTQTIPVESEKSPSAPTSVRAVTTNNDAKSFQYRQAMSRDYRQYIANLRAVHCPEETIQDILIAAINKDFAQREARERLRPQYLSPWELDRSENRDMGRLARLRELLLEKQNLVRELLGIEVPVELPQIRSDSTYAKLNSALQVVPAEKRVAVRLIQEEYWASLAKLDVLAAGQYDMEDWNQRKEILKNWSSSLNKILNENEIKEYSLKVLSSSRNESSPGNAFLTANLSEAEQKAIRLAQLGVQELLPPTGPGNDPDLQQAWQQVHQETEAKIREMLGEDRYKNYQKAQDSRYNRLQTLGQQFNLTPDLVEKAYEIEQLAREQNRRPADPEGLEKFRAQRQNVEQTLEQLLGQEAYQAYRGRTQGRRQNQPQPGIETAP